METGEIIKKLRKEKGITQEELANVLGLQKSAMSGIYHACFCLHEAAYLCGFLHFVKYEKLWFFKFLVPKWCHGRCWMPAWFILA